MNYIENWFHFYDTTESFEVHRKRGLINPDSICFLRETSQIYTQGTFIGICKERYENLEKMVLEHEAKLKNILGIEGPSVKDGIVNNFVDIVNFLDGFTDEDNLKEFIEGIKTAILAQLKQVETILTGRLDDLEGKINNDTEALHQAVDALKSQVDTINIRLDGHDTAITAINATLTSHLKEFRTLKENYDEFKSYTNTKFTAIDSSIQSILQSIQSLQDYFGELEEKFDDIEDEVAEAKSLIEDAKSLVKEVEDRFGSTLAELEQFKRDIKEELKDFMDLVGQPEGIAPLDNNAIIPAQYLPSYVDDVLEYATLGAFPVTGETGKIYVALDTNLQYRWSGTQYTELSKSLGIGETAGTAYPGDKGKKNADDIADHKADYNNPHRVTRTQLGLDKVNNTSDEDKPISTAQQAALDVLNTSITKHISDRNNPHNVTKEQVGLDRVDNTSDLEKPISTATQNALDTKVEKVLGKELSTNDFTNDDKNKLDSALTARKLTSEELSKATGTNLGEVVFNTTSNRYYFWTGVDWKELPTLDEVEAALNTKVDKSDLVYSYTVDFSQGTKAQEYNTGKTFTIKGIKLYNISDVTLHVGTNVANAAEGTVVPADTMLTWEIAKINNELPAAIGVILTYNED